MATGMLSEAAAVSVSNSIKGAALIAVCSVKPGVEVTDQLRDQLERSIVQGLGIPFRPKRVIFVTDIPKTSNMKILRRVIRAACTGGDPGDLSALVNPQSVVELAERYKTGRAANGNSR